MNFTTQGCARHGHLEVTLQLHRQVIPGGEKLLLSYFEQSVARGVHFEPGQTVGIGGHVLRLRARPDGTLGVEEPVPSPQEEWVEQIDRTVREVSLQKYVCESVSLPLTFPPARGSVLVAGCAEDADHLVLTRLPTEPEWPRHLSGWLLSCALEHDHGERQALPILALSALKPFVVQFLALPPETTVLVMPPGRAVVFHQGEEKKPIDGSYLAGLNLRD